MASLLGGGKTQADALMGRLANGIGRWGEYRCPGQLDLGQVPGGGPARVVQLADTRGPGAGGSNPKEWTGSDTKGPSGCLTQQKGGGVARRLLADARGCRTRITWVCVGVSGLREWVCMGLCLIAHQG
jgi:hypothetical protein